jgi:alkyl hydroperoxide reductase subunit AhpC
VSVLAAMTVASSASNASSSSANARRSVGLVFYPRDFTFV